MNETDIRNRILELCREDDHGSWQLWLEIFEESDQDDEDEQEMLQENFVQIVDDLVREEELIAISEGEDIDPEDFSMDRLDEEVSSAHKADPEEFYSFRIADGD